MTGEVTSGKGRLRKTTRVSMTSGIILFSTGVRSRVVPPDGSRSLFLFMTSPSIPVLEVWRESLVVENITQPRF